MNILHVKSINLLTSCVSVVVSAVLSVLYHHCYSCWVTQRVTLSLINRWLFLETWARAACGYIKENNGTKRYFYAPVAHLLTGVQWVQKRCKVFYRPRASMCSLPPCHWSCSKRTTLIPSWPTGRRVLTRWQNGTIFVYLPATSLQLRCCTVRAFWNRRYKKGKCKEKK